MALAISRLQLVSSAIFIVVLSLGAVIVSDIERAAANTFRLEAANISLTDTGLRIDADFVSSWEDGDPAMRVLGASVCFETGPDSLCISLASGAIGASRAHIAARDLRAEFVSDPL